MKLIHFSFANCVYFRFDFNKTRFPTVPSVHEFAQKLTNRLINIFVSRRTQITNILKRTFLLYIDKTVEEEGKGGEEKKREEKNWSWNRRIVNMASVYFPFICWAEQLVRHALNCGIIKWPKPSWTTNVDFDRDKHSVSDDKNAVTDSMSKCRRPLPRFRRFEKLIRNIIEVLVVKENASI